MNKFLLQVFKFIKMKEIAAIQHKPTYNFRFFFEMYNSVLLFLYVMSFKNLLKMLKPILS